MQYLYINTKVKQGFLSNSGHEKSQKDDIQSY